MLSDLVKGKCVFVCNVAYRDSFLSVQSLQTFSTDDFHKKTASYSGYNNIQ